MAEEGEHFYLAWRPAPLGPADDGSGPLPDVRHLGVESTAPRRPRACGIPSTQAGYRPLYRRQYVTGRQYHQYPVGRLAQHQLGNCRNEAGIDSHRADHQHPSTF